MRVIRPILFLSLVSVASALTAPVSAQTIVEEADPAESTLSDCEYFSRYEDPHTSDDYGWIGYWIRYFYTEVLECPDGRRWGYQRSGATHYTGSSSSYTESDEYIWGGTSEVHSRTKDSSSREYFSEWESAVQTSHESAGKDLKLRRLNLGKWTLVATHDFDRTAVILNSRETGHPIRTSTSSDEVLESYTPDGEVEKLLSCGKRWTRTELFNEEGVHIGSQEAITFEVGADSAQHSLRLSNPPGVESDNPIVAISGEIVGSESHPPGQPTQYFESLSLVIIIVGDDGKTKELPILKEASKRAPDELEEAWDLRKQRLESLITELREYFDKRCLGFLAPTPDGLPGGFEEMFTSLNDGTLIWQDMILP